MPPYPAEIQQLLYADSAGKAIGLERVQGLEPVPAERLGPLRALLDGPDEYLGYQAALVLAAWGNAAGLRKLEQLIDTRLDQRLVMAPHQVPDYDNGYDEMAGAVHRYGLSSAAEQPARRRVLGKLLALYGPCQFESKLKAALLQLDWAAELLPDMRAALARALALGRAELASQLLPPLARCEGRAVRALLEQFVPRPVAPPAPAVYANIVEALRLMPPPAVDAPAVLAIIGRIRRIPWRTRADTPLSQVNLMREYLRRAALVAQIMNRPGGGWPWFDAAARLTLPGAGQRELLGIDGRLLPGYAILDEEPEYWGPGTDPLEDQVLALNQHLSDSANNLSGPMRSVLLWAVRWAALKSHPALAPLQLPDLYEPLLVLMERGGWWRMEHHYIEFQDISGIGVSTVERAAQLTPMPSLDPQELDRLDALAERTEQARLLLERLAQVTVLLRADYAADPPAPAPEAAVQRLRQRVQVELGVELPEGYLHFLRAADGFNWNGLFVYATARQPLPTEPTVFVRDFIAANLAWRGQEPHQNHLFFAEGDGKLYAHHEGEDRYEVLDQDDGTVVTTFASAEALLAAALQTYLREDQNAKASGW